MEIILAPFKLVSVPLKFMLGWVGVVFGSMLVTTLLYGLIETIIIDANLAFLSWVITYKILVSIALFLCFILAAKD